MIHKIALTLCLVLLIGTLCVEGQRDGRRRSGRRKPTTESPPPVEETENENNPQKVDAEPETTAKSSSAEPIEPETKVPSADKEPPTDNKGGPPFIVPRGTRKPRPPVRSTGEQRPRPTLPSFAGRKRGPKPERREFKKNDDNSVVSTDATTSTTSKPSRGSSRNRGSNAQDRSSTVEKTSLANEEGATETPAPKKRFGGGATRRPSRGNRRYNSDES